MHEKLTHLVVRVKGPLGVTFWGNHWLIPFALCNVATEVFFSCSNVKCQRKTFVCPQGDVDCLYAPLSYSTNFITFPTRIRTPADLFTMRGPLSPYRRLVFDLKMIKAEDPASGEARVNRAFFAVRQVYTAFSLHGYSCHSGASFAVHHFILWLYCLMLEAMQVWTDEGSPKLMVRLINQEKEVLWFFLIISHLILQP